MRLTVSGLTKKVDELKAMAERMKDLSPAMQVGGQAVLKFISDRFRSQTDVFGQPWAPLALSTLLKRRGRKSARSIRRNATQAAVGAALGSGTSAAFWAKASGHARILQDTGVLRNSFAVTAGKKSITFGTAVPYAGPHQFGTRRIPKRSFLPVVATGGGFAFPASGPAQQLADRIRKAISKYVRTGSV